jgi:NAD(P)-dependent dehydrogenase (short-subunit alcohol dehydrogenase family)
MREWMSPPQCGDSNPESEEMASFSADEETSKGKWEQKRGQVALITGGSRGIGAETALALAECGYDIALTYRNKAARANEVISVMTQRGGHGLALPCDLTCAEDVARLFHHLKQWTDHLDALVLNASGGLERDIIAIDPHYPMRINHDAQLLFIDAALPLLTPGSTIVFVTSHWAHLYGQIKQFLPIYEPVARSKHAGELALRARQGEFQALGIRLVVVTGDLIEGTITPKYLERIDPELITRRRAKVGPLPTVAQMGQEIALTIINTTLSSGATVVVGEALQSLLSQSRIANSNV